jgi:hypothetical protein
LPAGVDNVVGYPPLDPIGHCHVDTERLEHCLSLGEPSWIGRCVGVIELLDAPAVGAQVGTERPLAGGVFFVVELRNETLSRAHEGAVQRPAVDTREMCVDTGLINSNRVIILVRHRERVTPDEACWRQVDVAGFYANRLKLDADDEREDQEQGAEDGGVERASRQ